jgi:hypothetical protein
MAGLVGRIPIGQIRPLGSSPQDPKNAIEHLSAAAPGPSPPISSPRQIADERFENGPLVVRQIHDSCILLIGYSVSPVYEMLCSLLRLLPRCLGHRLHKVVHVLLQPIRSPIGLAQMLIGRAVVAIGHSHTCTFAVLRYTCLVLRQF